ncbi:MAG TPA: gamma carbonic anhydrase family protein, partial [Thermoplasmataceae archaeon]|nr:gamma carbonic anhydrase family protein [Thermoplasmataceae archaeon]
MVIEIGKKVYLAETAVLIGEVKLSDGVSVFDHSVLRGDLNQISIGTDSNIQDNVTIHVEKYHPTVIGRNVSVGHNAIIHGAKVEESVIVGMGAILLNGSHIRSGSVVAAGAVVREGFESEENSIVAGIPATTKKVDESVRKYAVKNGESYQKLRDRYLAGKVEKRYGKGEQ